MLDILEILLGQLPEALYFAIFMILAKRIKNKRILFTSLMIIEYILLFSIVRYSIWYHVFYFVISYIILKILYKEKSQITDIFTISIASIILIISNIILYPIALIFNNYIIFVISNIILTFVILYLLRNKLHNIQNMYKKFWNRNDKVIKRMKSTTFRCLNLVLFNISFYIINIFMIYCLFNRR